MPKNGFILLIAIVAVVTIFFTMISSGGSDTQKITLDDALKKIKAGDIQEIVVKGGDKLQLTDFNDNKFKADFDKNIDILALFDREGIPITGGNNAPSIEFKGNGGIGSGWLMILVNFLPLILFGALLIFLMRRAQGGPNQAMGFAKSKARMFSGDKPTVNFSDVAGVEEAKEELSEVVDFLKHAEKFVSLGARIPRGVLLVGPPGTGKTLLSRAVAGEAGVPFFSISGSEFVEMFVGVGAARVRDLFEQAKRNAPCIVFVDEIDAVGRHRGAGLGGGHDEREQTLNQILTEMDGFDTNTNVIVIAATNRPDILDPALLRPGRFDRRVVLDQPDINGRKAILKVHAKGKPLDATVDFDIIAKQTPGFSGADLANLVNEAAILAVRREKKEISLPEFEESVDRVIAGPERKSRVMSAKEKEIVAYHESGHALVARMLPNADPVHKISIIARGMMGGYTRQLPTEDRYLVSRAQFNDMLATLLGGHVAEELIFNDITTGASNDLERATQIARTMVMRYGMSDRIEYDEIPISEVLQEIRNANIECIEVHGNDLLVKMKDGRHLRSRKEIDASLVEILQQNQIDPASSDVKIYVKESKGIGGLGLRVYGKREEMIFLGREISEQRDYGDEIADEIDAEVHNIIERSYNLAKDILNTNKTKLIQIAERLIADETIEGETLDQLFDSPVTGAPETDAEAAKPSRRGAKKSAVATTEDTPPKTADETKRGGDLSTGGAEPTPASP